MNKEELCNNLKVGEGLIKKIEGDQLILVENYVRANYNIVKESVILLNDIKVRVHHFSFSESGRKINLHYQLVKANGKAESTIFTKLLGNNLKIKSYDVP